MSTQPGPSPPGALPEATARRGRLFRGLFVLRKPIAPWEAALLGLLCIAVVLLGWWFVTRGEGDERLVDYYTLPSPAEAFGKFYPELWIDRELTLNTLATLRRLALGFGLATVIGVPLGVLCGCFPRVQAFLNPLTIFGRNIPIAALIPLMMLVFSRSDEEQRVMFIFIACVAFIVSDTARAVAEVGAQYVDTAYTLGARSYQVILKVLVPLAMPSVFNSLRLLFGLAFGYIMLAEVMKTGEEQGGLGYIINVSQRRGPREHIYLLLLIIPALALGIDRLLFWIQRELFPYRYGGTGLLHQAVGAALHAWDDLKCALRRSPAPADLAAPAPAERKQP